MIRIAPFSAAKLELHRMSKDMDIIVCKENTKEIIEAFVLKHTTSKRAEEILHSKGYAHIIYADIYPAKSSMRVDGVVFYVSERSAGARSKYRRAVRVLSNKNRSRF